MRTLKHEDACLSNYALDRWLGGQLSDDESRASQEHVESCTRCSLRWDELNRQRTAFYACAPSWDAFETQRSAAPPKPARRPWSLPLMAAAGLLAVGAGLGVGLGGSELHSSATERS